MARNPVFAATVVACCHISSALLSPPSRLASSQFCRTHSKAFSLFGMLPRGEDGSRDSMEESDVEAARRRFEAMMGGSGADSNGGDIPKKRQKNQSPPLLRRVTRIDSTAVIPETLDDSPSSPPPLTTIGRERRQAEIIFLSSLDDSDGPLSDLWSLWFAERGPKAASKLLAAEELVGLGPAQWPKAEEQLGSLIEEYGIYWAEPVNRLATLMYLQGRLEESKALCEAVLTVKPWHFGALSGIVLVCAAMGDTLNARMWAARRLPPMQPTGNNERRTAWVSRAVEEAKTKLWEAEERMKETYGEGNEDDQEENTQGSMQQRQVPGVLEDEDDTDELDDAWQ